MALSVKDAWELGAAYEPYVGRWSRLVAREFVRTLRVPSNSDWVDVGCGTGALADAILRNASPRSVQGVDASEAFVEYARSQVADTRATFRVGDAMALPQGDASATAVVSGLMLNFVAKPSVAVAEMARVAVRGGVVAAYVWDYADRMDLMRYFWDAAVELDPAADALDEGRRFPICAPDMLFTLFENAGLSDVTVRSIDVPTPFTSFDDFWSPFLGGQGPAPGYAMSLGEEQRGALRERLREMLPQQADGSIRLIARAWAVRGKT